MIRIVGDDGSNQKAAGKPDGSFRFDLQRGVRYVMLAGAEGYLNGKQEFASDPDEADAEYGVDFVLAAINKPQVVENIFYDYDKASLRPESKQALDEMVQVMKDNPHIAIDDVLARGDDGLLRQHRPTPRQVAYASERDF